MVPAQAPHLFAGSDMFIQPSIAAALSGLNDVCEAQAVGRLLVLLWRASLVLSLRLRAGLRAHGSAVPWARQPLPAGTAAAETAPACPARLPPRRARGGRDD